MDLAEDSLPLVVFARAKLEARPQRLSKLILAMAGVAIQKWLK